MIIYRISLSQIVWDSYFRPIRSKQDILTVLMNCIRLANTNISLLSEEHVGKLTIFKNKNTHRFVISKAEQYYSFAIPFRTQATEEGTIEFSHSGGTIIDSMMVSAINTLLKSDIFNLSNDVMGTLEITEAVSEEMADDTIRDWLWPIFQDLLAYNDGYLRYDHDAENADGHFHPVHHLDIFYSNQAQIKAGLMDLMQEESFIDFLNKETECHYAIHHNRMP